MDRNSEEYQQMRDKALSQLRSGKSIQDSIQRGGRYSILLIQSVQNICIMQKLWKSKLLAYPQLLQLIRYISQVSIYRSAKCVGCPVRGLCNKAKGNRQIEVNHTLNLYKEKIRYLLSSEEGIFHRKKRPIEPEAVFADIKEAGRFRRFRLRGVTGAGIEFGLKAIAHNIKKIAARIAQRDFFDGKSQKTTHYWPRILQINYYRKEKAA